MKRINEPEVIPKGKSRKAIEKAARTKDHRCTVYAYTRFCPAADGTSGVRYMFVTSLERVKVNGVLVTDPAHEVKPGDVISVKGWDDKWYDYTVEADNIEHTWGGTSHA